MDYNHKYWGFELKYLGIQGSTEFKMPGVRKVALLIDIRTGWEQNFVSGIARYFRVHGSWQLYIPTVSNRNPVAKLDIPFWINRTKPDGIVITDSIPNLKHVIAMRIPTIINTVVDKRVPGVPNIRGDHKAAAIMAAEHFLDRSFHNFAFCGFDQMYWSRERSKAFREHLAAAGFDTFIYSQPETEQQRHWSNEQHFLLNWIKSLPQPVGIFACSDERGRNVTELCETTGLSVPDRVAVVGVNNDTLICEISTPPLSSVERDFERAGFEAAELLDWMIRTGKRKCNKTILIKPRRVVVRRSSDILAIEDPEVARAVKFIHENAQRSITVEDVARAALTSRSVLYKKFRLILKRSIATEIKRVRVAAVERMLTETDMTIQQIVYRLNFSEIGNMSRYFYREKGIRPAEYRKMHRGSRVL